MSSFREYPEGTKSGSDSDDETEKGHFKDDLLESEFRKRRIKVADCDGHVICLLKLVMIM